MLRPASLCALVVFTGCVAQVRGTRVQKPFTVIAEKTRVGLISVEVPEWVQPPTPGDDVQELVKSAVVKALATTALVLDDQASAGARFSIGPKVAPIIVTPPPGRADQGLPWPVTLMAVGAPPISWKLISAPPGMSLDPVTGAISWTPNVLGRQKVVVSATNPFGESRYEASVDVQPRDTRMVQAPRPFAPSIAPQVEFGSLPPQNAPGGAPLLMGVQVVSVVKSTETMQAA